MKKIFLILIIAMLIATSVSVEAAPKELYENCDSYEDLYDYVILGDSMELEPMWAQTITIGETAENENHQVKYIDLFLHKEGKVKSVTLSIRTLSNRDDPSFLEISSKTIRGRKIPTEPGWVRFKFTDLTFDTSHQYALVLSADINNYPNNHLSWHCDWMGHYNGGTAFYSDDTEDYWDERPLDCQFRVYGLETKVYESCSGTLGDNKEVVREDSMKAQVFQVGATGLNRNHRTCSFSIPITKMGYAYTMTLHLKHADPETGPYGEDLATRTLVGRFAPDCDEDFQWIDFSFKNVKLLKNEWYAICLSVDVPDYLGFEENKLYWHGVSNSWPVTYPGSMWTTYDSGNNWVEISDNGNLMFEEIGL